MTHTSIIVTQKIGEFSRPECTLDQFEEGVLTISSTRTGEIIETCYRSEWLDATVYDERGNPVFSFINEAAR